MKTLLSLLFLLSIQNSSVNSGGALASVREGLTKFSATLYQGVAKDAARSENIVISPISIAAVTCMVLVGARANTASQMKTAFNTPQLTVGMIGNSVAQLIDQVQEDASHQFKSFNRIFVSNDYPLDEHYQTFVTDVFRSSPESLDFSSADTVDRINHQVLNFTNNKIKESIPRDAVSYVTAMILLNAVYFKGHWDHQFKPSKTRPMNFHVPSSSRPIMAQMMHTQGKFRLANLYRLDTRVLELPYKGRRLSMLIFLPNSSEGLEFLEMNLMSALLDDLDGEMRPTATKVVIPKFTVEASSNVKRSLEEMGVKDLFDPTTANLLGISNTEGLFVSKAFHRTFIEVNEQGSQAAAVASFRVSSRHIAPINSFVADHPFLYIIRDNHSKTILFMGRYVNPS